MKIRMTYTADEVRHADRLLQLLRGLLPGSRVHAGIRGDFRHLTISAKQGESKKNS